MIRTLSIQIGIGSTREEKNTTRRQAKMLMRVFLVNYPSDGWSINLTKMPFFTRAEMKQHISKSGENIGSNTSTHSVPTSVRKATTFVQDEYLKEILAVSDESYFYFKAQYNTTVLERMTPLVT